MLRVSLLSILIVILWLKVCQPEETTIGSDIDSSSPQKIQPKLYVVLLPPVFSVIGITLIGISILTTIFCVAYCVFLPWAHALSSKTSVQVAAVSSPDTGRAADVPHQPYYNTGAAPPYPYYTGGGGPYFPNQPYPYYAGPSPPHSTDCTTTTTATTTISTTSKPSTSQTPEQQNVKETEEFVCDI